MSSSEDIQIVKKYRFLFSVRSYVAVITCFCMATQYAQRLNMTIAIVCMVNHTGLKAMSNISGNKSILHTDSTHFKENYKNVQINNSIDTSDDYKYQENGVNIQRNISENPSNNHKDGPFLWDENMKGRLLSSYYFGYIVFQLCGGILAYKYGPRLILLLSMSAGTITTFLTPAAANISFTLVFTTRLLTGLSAGLVWPSLVELSSRWSPKDEKSVMLATAYSGAQIGPIIYMPLYGSLCAMDFLNGWPLVFYAGGLMGIIWCVACILTITNNPDNNKFISSNEKKYIKQNVILTVTGKQMDIPLKNIFTSVPCLIMFACYFLNCAGFYTILSYVSTIMKDVFGFNIEKNGAATAIPYLFYFIMAISSGIVADRLIRNKILTTQACRKCFTGIGNAGAAAAIFAMGYVNKNSPWVGVLMFTITLASLGLNSGGLFIVPQDMSPKYAGIIWGIANTFGSIPGFVAPLIVGRITKDSTREQWRIVFMLCAITHGLCALLFVIFGSSKLLPWSDSHKSSDDID